MIVSVQVTTETHQIHACACHEVIDLSDSDDQYVEAWLYTSAYNIHIAQN